MKICLESNKIMKKKKIDTIVPKYKVSNKFYRFIYNPVIFPGASVAEKWGLEFFGGKCLKLRRLSDFLHGIVFPREVYYAANAYSVT